MESGRDEEEEALEDSMNDPSTPIQLRAKSGKKTPEGRAPTMTIEVVRVGRPLKVLSLLSTIVSLLLFTMGTAGTSWIFTEQHRVGLFQECYSIFKGSEEVQSHLWDNCVTVTEPTWQRLLCVVLDLVSLLLTLLGAILLIVGMLIMDIGRKTKIYKIVLVDFALACVAMLVTVIYFPIEMSQFDRQTNSNTTTSIGWSCIVNCVGCLFLILAIILLAVDRKSEELVYRETVHRFSEYNEEE